MRAPAALNALIYAASWRGGRNTPAAELLQPSLRVMVLWVQFQGFDERRLRLHRPTARDQR
jgi:hypothetical protein